MLAAKDRTEEFVRLYTRHQQEIYAFVLTLVPHRPDADDVLQETGVVLWRKFEEFRKGTNFVRWGNQVAYFEILNFYKRQGKDRMLLDEGLMEQLIDLRTSLADDLRDQRAALAGCLAKLSQKDRDLIERRYRDKSTVRVLSEEVRRPVGGIYKSLQRILKSLFDCVHREMRRGGIS